MRGELHLYKGEMLVAAEIARRAGMDLSTLINRMKKGYTAEEAADMPTKKAYCAAHFFDGKYRSINEIAEIMGIGRSTLAYRIYSRGMTAEEAAGADIIRNKAHAVKMIADRCAAKAEIRECGEAYEFDVAEYTLQIRFVGEDRAELTAVFRGTGRKSLAREYRISKRGIEEVEARSY